MESSNDNDNSSHFEESLTLKQIDGQIDQEIVVDQNKRSNQQIESDFKKAEILDHIKNSSAVFQSQQIDDPELTTTEKRQLAEELLDKKPENFLLKFGKFLNEEYLNYFSSRFSTSYEIQYYVKNFKNLLNDHNKKVIKRNRRYEAMKRMEAEGSYFSEIEMEKREPLLYHQMVGQYLSEKEKILKNRQTQKNSILSFSAFLMNKMEREEMDDLIKTQQEEEDKIGNAEISSEEELQTQNNVKKRWGEDWDEEKSRKKLKKKQLKKQSRNISSKEKNLLLQEFVSIMKTNFLNGKDADFNYSEVDSNPDYDSVELRAQDEEEKYFDEETCNSAICTDTGVEDY